MSSLGEHERSVGHDLFVICSPSSWNIAPALATGTTPTCTSSIQSLEMDGVPKGAHLEGTRRPYKCLSRLQCSYINQGH